MSSERARRKMRWWVPGLILVGLGGFVVSLFVTDDVSRYFAAVAAVVLAVPLLALWYIFLTQLPWKKRFAYFGAWVVAILIAGAALVGLTRWDGSLNGGAIPRLVWKWSVKPDEKLEALEGRGGDPTLAAKSNAVFAQFLGPHRNGVLDGPRLDPDWSAHPPQELWRREIGAGFSGFMVMEGRAVTQEQRGELELVTCYDLGTGEPIWVHENKTRFSETMGGDGPRATPTFFGGNVYVMGATGILDCLVLSTGKPVWSRNILTDHKDENVMYGKAASPLILLEGGRGLVIVTGGKKGPTLQAYDSVTGEPIWVAGDDQASYASPIVATLAGRKQIVSLNHNSVSGHDVASGEILWKWDWPAKMPKSAVPQAVGDNRVFVSASYGMGTALLEITREGEGFGVKKIWKNLQMKTKFSSVCIKDGFAYGLDEGRLACVEVATGERKWRGTNYGYGQNLLIGDLLLVQTERGPVTLVKATPGQFEEVARLDALSDKTWNTPTLAGEYLLVRNEREAVCYKVKVNP